MRNQPIRILLTCIGGFFGLDLIRSIKMDPELPVHLIGLDANPNVVARHYVDAFYSISSTTDNLKSYAEELLDICIKEAVQVLIPSADEEVLAVSAYLDNFRAHGILCTVEPYETLLLLRDKIKTFDKLKSAGLHLPIYQSILSIDDVNHFAALVGYPENPFILKPNTGRGARGLFVVDPSVQHLEKGYEARGYEIGNVEMFQQLAENQPDRLTNLMAMELLQGNVHDVDCLSNDGTPVCIMVRERLTTNQFSRGVEGHEIIENELMKEFVTKAINILNFNYCNDFDFLLLKDGKPGLIEINPRWSGSVVSGIAAGVNFPNLLIRKTMGLPLPENISIQTGVKCYPVHRLMTPGFDKLV